MFRRFFHWIGKPGKEGLPNTWLSCGLLCVLGLLLALPFGMRAAEMADAALHKESFVLESAEHYFRSRRRSDKHELRLQGTDGESYAVEDALISEAEIEAALEKLHSGETVDVWLNEHGIVTQLSCGGENLLDSEKVVRLYGAVQRGLRSARSLAGNEDLPAAQALGKKALMKHFTQDMFVKSFHSCYNAK